MPIIQPTAAPIAAHLPSHARTLALALPRVPPPRRRSLASPFRPGEGDGPYRLPREAAERLADALSPCRNRDRSWRLAMFLARFWSAPGRLTGAFPIDRRALASHAHLGLTEAEVRGAVGTLEAAGFLARAIPPKGNGYQRRGGGELHRRPVLWMFGADYASAFAAANRRAQAVRRRREGERRPVSPSPSPRPPSASPMDRPANSPRVTIPTGMLVLMGEIEPRPPEPGNSNPRLEAALDRLLRGIRQSREA